MCIKKTEVRVSTLWAVFLKFVVDYMYVPLSFALPVHTSTASTAGYPKGWVTGTTDHFHMYHTVQSQPVWCVIPVQNWIPWADLKHFSLQKTKLWGAAGSGQDTAALSVPELWKDGSEGRSLPSCCRSRSSYLSKVGKRQNTLPDPKCGIHLDSKFCDQCTVAKCLRTYERLRVSEGFNCPTSLDCLGVSDLLLVWKIWGISTPTLTPASG